MSFTENGITHSNQRICELIKLFCDKPLVIYKFIDDGIIKNLRVLRNPSSSVGPINCPSLC